MNGLHPQTWRCRVADLLDDPVAEAVLRRDGLSRDDVFAILAPVADALTRRRLRERGAGPWAFAEADAPAAGGPLPHESKGAGRRAAITLA